MSDNGSVPSPPMKDSDHLFGPSEIGPKFAYEAGIRRKIISNNDMFPDGLVTSEDFELVNLKNEGLYVIISLR
ncbi:hypothetical protein OROHE_010237 [Orobanche hederae]